MYLNYESLKNKKVLIRVDFNVPIQNGIVTDISRLKQVAPTIKFLKKSKAKIILISHLGKTAVDGQGESLKVVIDDLSRIYNSNIVFIDDCLSVNAHAIIESASYEDIILLENLRFYKEEEQCDPAFARKLAALGDFYINEAFSVAHRKHASVYEIPKLLPHAFGISFLQEIKAIDEFLSSAQSPKMCIVGGSKLSTKIKLLKNLTKKVDKLALGGKIATTFLSFRKDPYIPDHEYAEYRLDVEEILDNTKKFGCELVLPTDFISVVEEDVFMANAVLSKSQLNSSILDIGPKSIDFFKQHLRESACVLWNGPVGLFEQTPFDFGTSAIAKEIAKLTKVGKITSIIGGGDTVFALNKCGVADAITHLSTSGGAFLTYLEGSELPGMKYINDAYKLQDL